MAGRKRGLLIGCLIALAAVAVLAAFVAIGFRRGELRSRQKRSIADLLTLDTAISAYAEEHGQYPPAKTFKRLVGLITPKYMNFAPQTDGWGTHYWYNCWKVDPRSPGCDAYVIVSPGADRQLQFTSGQQYREHAIKDPAEDLVVGRRSLTEETRFVQYPEGMALK